MSYDREEVWQLAATLGLNIRVDQYDPEFHVSRDDREIYKSYDLEQVHAFLLGWCACLAHGGAR